jgi:hypothetical protein
MLATDASIKAPIRADFVNFTVVSINQLAMPGVAWAGLQTIQTKKHGLYQHAAFGREAASTCAAALKRPARVNTPKPA